MHLVIMGCGRVGATLAKVLERQGHDVAIIDQSHDAFRRLGPNFKGRQVTGLGFDQETLKEAGIEQAYAFAAVSSGDNSNILSARVARETFGIEQVVARIYDPERAEIYQRLGIPTVATVRWTAGQMLRRLVPQGAAPDYVEPSGKVAVAEVPAHERWIGRTIEAIEAGAGARVAYLTRLGEAHIPTGQEIFQEGDLLHMLTPLSDISSVEQRLDQPPPD